MPANVVKCSHFLAFAADDHDGLAGDFVQKVIAWLAQSIDMADKEPMPKIDSIHVEREDFRRYIEISLKTEVGSTSTNHLIDRWLILDYRGHFNFPCIDCQLMIMLFGEVDLCRAQSLA
jgi:hypothetical protein